MDGKRSSEEQLQILRLTTPELKKTLGAPFAQDDSSIFLTILLRMTAVFFYPFCSG